MKNILKNSYKLVVIILLLAAMLVAPSLASASGNASFSSNGVFKVGNHANAGTTNWVGSLSNMKPGDQVQFLFTYVNTSSNTAISALSSYSVSNNGNSITVTGTAWADNASQVTGSVTIYAAPGYTISLTPTQVSSGGPGNVAGNSTSYHSTSLVTLGGNQTTAQNPTANLWAEYPNGTSVTQVPLGTAPYLHWTSTNASECHVLAGAGFSTGGATSGQDQVSAMAGTTTFSIQCTNSSGGSVQANATVSVSQPPALNPTANISANPTNISSGNTTVIQWSSTNATECHATQGPGFSTGGATSGSVSSGAIFNTTTYAITCTNSSGSASNSATVTVNSVPPVNNPTANIYVSPSSVNQGQPTTISWSSTNATSCYGTGFSTGNATSGSTSSGAIYSTTTYSVTCTNSSGSAYDSATVTVNSAPPVNNPTANISANPTSISSGNTTVIQWSSTNATECHATQGPGFSTGGATSGSDISSALTGNSTFSVTCTNGSGSNSANVTVFVDTTPTGSAPTAQTNAATGVTQNSATLNGSVNPNGAQTYYSFEYGTSQSLGNSTSLLSAGGGTNSQNVTASVSGLVANTTYYFRVDAQNTYGSVQGSILSFTTNSGGTTGNAPAVITQSASGVSDTSATVSGTVDPKGDQTTYWFEYGTTQSLGSLTTYLSAGNGSGAQTYTAPLNFLSSNTTYYYRIDARNSYGTSQGSILSFTTTGGGGGGCTTPYVQTQSASNVYQNSAQLNGSVNSNNCQTNYWFEYGTSWSLGNTTSNQSAGSSNGQMNISSYISGLNYNSTYYFRAVAQNNSGISYGSILSFTTNGGNYCNGYNCGNNNGAPYVQTLSATNYTGNSVVFNGSVTPNSNGYDTAYGWFEYGTDMNSLNLSTYSQYVGSGNYSQNFSQQAYNLVSGNTYYYRAAARTSYGTAYGQILSTGGGYYNNSSAPQVITNAATYVQNNSALLNGQVDANGAVTTSWFEYGTTQNLGNQTSQQAVGSGTNYQNVSAALSGLSANTTYYFRVDAQNSYGTVYGSILSFTTSGGGTIVVPQNPVVIRTVSTVSNLSCLILVPSLNVSQLTPGQNFTLTVTYRNGCVNNYSNVFLKVILPQGTDFVSTNYPFFNRDANGISYNLGALPANFQSAVSIEGIATNSLNPGDSVIFSAVLNYNDVQGRFQSLSAYLTAVVGSGQALGATVLTAFGNLLGNWIFDLILVFLIIFLIYWIFLRKPKEVKSEEDVLEARPIN